MEVETPLQTAIEPSEEARSDDSGSPGLASTLAVEHGAAGTESSAPETPAQSAKRPGRPPIHGRYSQAAGSDGKNPVPLPGEREIPSLPVEVRPAPRVRLPPDLLARVVSRGVGLGERYAQSKFKALGKLAGLTEEEIQPQLDQGKMPDEDKQLLGAITPLMLEEWGLDPEVSPTAAFLTVTLPWAVTAGDAYLTLARLAKERQRRITLRETGNRKPEKAEIPEVLPEVDD